MYYNDGKIYHKEGADSQHDQCYTFLQDLCEMAVCDKHCENQNIGKM